jgi:WD40 repeat protein
MIEAAWFSGSDLILYGFKSKNFIVWNEKKQYEISSVECGGAHRSYAYSPTTGSDGAGYFIYTKASKLYLHSQQRPSHQIIKSGGHGREIKAAAVSPDGLVATGAEDTAIRIWQFQDGKLPAEKQFDCLAVVQKHTTGIQHLQWHGSNYLFSSGGNEEFFIWAVEAIPGFGIGVVCEASCLDESEEKDLRIMSFDITSLPQSGEGPERILISLAYSDSTTRSYIYSKTEKFRFLATGRYMSSCLMQLRHLDIRGQELFFLTAGTDGYLTTWRTVIVDRSTQASRSMVIVPLSHRVHQSSIKCLDIIKKDNNFVVVTGGDDNALAVTIYQAALEARPRSIILRSAHAAAITALRVVSAVNGKAMRIVTSSNDQRVKEWGLSLNDSEDMNNLAVTKLGDVFTSVADVGDVTVLTREEEAEKVMVVGNGMEVYKVSRVHS